MSDTFSPLLSSMVQVRAFSIAQNEHSGQCLAQNVVHLAVHR